MQDKGYAHPLYSMHLVRPGSGATAPPAAIEVQEGLLVVSPALLARADKARSAECYGALCAALAHWGRAEALLSPYGLDGAWAASVRHWGERLLAWEAERQGLVVALAGRAWPRRALASRGRQLWRQLALAVQLAGPPEPRQVAAARGPIAPPWPPAATGAQGGTGDATGWLRAPRPWPGGS